MNSKIKLLLSCFLFLFVVTLVSCGDDDEKKEPTVPEVYFISYSAFDPDDEEAPYDETIKRFMADDPANTTVFLDITDKSGAGIAYDSKRDKIYYTDFWDYYVGNVWSMDLEETPTPDDIVNELYEPYGIAIDEEAGKIYFVDGADDTDEDEDGNFDDPEYDESHIYRANLDGSNVETVVHMQNALFRPLAIDPDNNKIYFYDDNLENLYMADLSNGGNQQVILEGAYGYGIAIDTKNNKIYFDDQNADDGNGALMMDDLDGTYPLTPTEVDKTGSRIYGIAIDNENKKLYWSASGNGEIYQSDLNGDNKIILKTGLLSPRGLFLKK